MNKILQGILKFRNTVRPSLLPTLQKVAGSAKPEVLLITCVDSRLMPGSFTSTIPGQMFIVRNVGNLFPHARLFGSQAISNSAEPAALELAVVNYGIKHVAVCGHSDCKAMEGLYNTLQSSNVDNTSMITKWITTHGNSSLTKLDQLIINDNHPVKLTFNEDNDAQRFEAVIDKKLSIVDKLSQINVLQQLHNIGSYSFVREQLQAKQLNLHALWFDIGNGEMHMFSKENGTFELVNEDTVATIFKNV